MSDFFSGFLNFFLICLSVSGFTTTTMIISIKFCFYWYITWLRWIMYSSKSFSSWCAMPWYIHIHTPLREIGPLSFCLQKILFCNYFVKAAWASQWPDYDMNVKIRFWWKIHLMSRFHVGFEIELPLDINFDIRSLKAYRETSK